MTKNDNFKEYGMPVVVLVAICFVTTLLLALTNSVSEPIRRSPRQRTEKSCFPKRMILHRSNLTAMLLHQTARHLLPKFTRQITAPVTL